MSVHDLTAKYNHVRKRDNILYYLFANIARIDSDKVTFLIGENMKLKVKYEGHYCQHYSVNLYYFHDGYKIFRTDINYANKNKYAKFLNSKNFYYKLIIQNTYSSDISQLPYNVFIKDEKLFNALNMFYARNIDRDIDVKISITLKKELKFYLRNMVVYVPHYASKYLNNGLKFIKSLILEVKINYKHHFIDFYKNQHTNVETKLLIININYLTDQYDENEEDVTLYNNEAYELANKYLRKHFVSLKAIIYITRDERLEYIKILYDFTGKKNNLVYLVSKTVAHKSFTINQMQKMLSILD
jgi:hypothetical protein